MVPELECSNRGNARGDGDDDGDCDDDYDYMRRKNRCEKYQTEGGCCLLLSVFWSLLSIPRRSQTMTEHDKELPECK